MKYLKITIATLIFLMSFAMHSNEAEAQCPTGFYNTTVNMVAGDCTYEVELCVYCGDPTPSGHQYGEAHILGITRIPTTPECNPLTFQQVLDQIYSQISTYNFIDLYLCPDFGTPELCPNDDNEFTVYEYPCWKKGKYLFNGVETIGYTPCSWDEFCIITYAYCLDPQTGTIKRIEKSTTPPTSISCTLEGYEVPDPENLYEESDCFIYHTSCE